jgi:hypothetical protein
MMGKLIFLVFFIYILAACSGNKLDVNVDQIQLSLNQKATFNDLMVEDSNQLLVTLHKNQKDFPEITEFQLGYCLKMPNDSDSSFYSSIRIYQKDPYIIRLHKALAHKFKDVSKYEVELQDGFKHLRHHLPKAKMPKSIVYMNSLFNASAFCTDQEIGIGMERYLGVNNPVIKELPNNIYFDWMKKGFDEKFLTVDAVSSWINTHIIEEKEGNVSENMIRWGKILYLTKAAYPSKSDAEILRYSEKQFQWAISNEQSLWDYLVKEKLLFKLDVKTSTNLLNDGPFTVGLPEKGPDRLGRFIGYRIVSKFMEIKEIRIEELVKTSYTDILQEYEIAN